jgi:hypothetical protein
MAGERRRDFSQRYDNFSSAIKARRAGFVDCIDTEEKFGEEFAELRKDSVIP